jgi:hypothetical protein
MPPLPLAHLDGMKEPQLVHPVLPTLAPLSLVKMSPALALRLLNLLNLPSQKIIAYPTRIILFNRQRRSWRVSVSRKPGNQTKVPSRTRNGRTPKLSAVMRVRSTFQELEKRPEERGIG